MNNIAKKIVLLTATGIAFASANVSALSWSKDSHTVYAGDFDGDNIDELLLVAKHNLGTHAIIKSNAGDYNLVLKQWTNGDANGLWLNWSESRIQIGDVDGDSIDDIYLQDSNQTNIIKNTSFEILSHITQTLVTSFGISWAKDNYKIHVGDFNGDGQSDLLAQPNTPNSHTLTIHADSAGQYSSVDLLFTGETQGVDWSQYYSHITIVDLDADGKDDVLLTAEPHLLPLTLGDEGEEMAFHVPIIRDPHNVVFRADPNGIFTQGIIGWSWDVDYLDTRWDTASVKIHAGDFDNDGHNDDLLLQSINGTSYFVYGTGGIPTSKTVASHPGVNFESSELTILDSDGDGASDIYFNTAGTPVLLQHVSGTSFNAVNQSSEAVGVQAVVTVNKTTGTTADTFIFNAKDSELAEEYCYDWDNDGSCETPWSVDPVATRVFLSAGTHTVRLKARNADGDADSVTLGVSVTAYAVPANEYEHTAPTITTAAVGTLDGNFNISPSGAATYSLQVSVPPGRTNMHPDLSISYSSQNSGNSILGIGWSISGLSSITRCRKIRDHGETNSSILWDNTDQFCLDGQRLIPISGANGQNGTEYRTLQDTYSKIISYASNETDGPNKFLVLTKDGKKIVYGHDGSSHKAYRKKSNEVYYSWLISSIDHLTADLTEVSQNAINFHYDDSNNNVIIDKITYTSNGSADTREVDFIYESQIRPDRQLYYTSGLKVEVTKRLESIKTYVNSAPVYEYRFRFDNTSYFAAVESENTRLAGVVNCAFDGHTPRCLPEVEFNYSTAYLHFEDKEDINVSLSDQEQKRHFLLDMNGDGVQDFVYFDFHAYLADDCTGNCEAQDFGWKVHFGQRDGDQFSAIGYLIALEPDYGISKESAKHAQLIDIYGDGRQDLMVPTSNGWGVLRYSNTSSDYSNCLETDKACFSFESTGITHTNGSTSRPKVVDINGDSIQDFIWHTDFKVFYKLNNGHTFQSGSEVVIADLETDYVNRYPDPDVLTTERRKIESWTWNRFNYLDLEGDGDLDIIFQKPKIISHYIEEGAEYPCVGTTKVLRWDQSNASFVEESLSENLFYQDDEECYDNTLVIDINKDGLQDLVYGNAENKNWYLALNKGNTEFEPPTVLSLNTDDFPIDGARVTDVNADGMLDIMTLKSNRILFAVNKAGEQNFINTDPRIHFFNSHSNLYAQSEDVIGDGEADLVADFNGDGVDDVLYLDGGIKLRLGTGSGFNGSLITADSFMVGSQPLADTPYEQAMAFGIITDNITEANNYLWANLRIVDFDEDGKTEIAYITPSLEKETVENANGPGANGYRWHAGCGLDLRILTLQNGQLVDSDIFGGWSDQCPLNYTFGDMTGDGSPDIIAGLQRKTMIDETDGTISEIGYHNWVLFENSGGALLSASETSVPLNIAKSQYLDITDYNNDGKKDIIAYHNDFITAFINQTSTTYDALGVELEYFGDQNAFLVKKGDINGDGMPDLVRGKGIRINYSINKSQTPNLLMSINHGLNIQTNIQYETLSNTDVYTAFNTHDENGNIKPECYLRSVCITAPMKVVSSHQATSGFSDTGQTLLSSYEYKYSDLRADKFGHGLLGFATFSTLDNNPNGAGYDSELAALSRSIESTVTFENTDSNYDSSLKIYPYLGMPVSAVKTLNGEVQSERDTVYEYASTQGSGLPYRVRIRSTEDRTYTIGLANNYLLSIASMDYQIYDYQYGNEKVLVGISGDGTITHTTNTYWDDLDGTHWDTHWMIGRLRSSEVTVTRQASVFDISTSAYGATISNGEDSHTRRAAFNYDRHTGVLAQEIVEPTNTLIGKNIVAATDITSPETKVTTYIKDAFGHTHITRIDSLDDLGNVISRQVVETYDMNHYDAVYTQSISNELQHEQIFDEYNEKFGLPIKVIGPNGISSYTYYDAFGREVHKQTETGNFVSTTYSSYTTSNGLAGKQIEIIDSDNGYSVTYFDALDRAIATRASQYSSEDNLTYVVTRKQYDSLGHEFKVSQPYRSSSVTPESVIASMPTAWAYSYYDQYGRTSRTRAPFLTTQESTSSEITHTEKRIDYDYEQINISDPGEDPEYRNLLKIKTTDELSNERTEFRNLESELIKLIDEAGKATYYDYTSTGNLSWMQDPLGNVTHITYDQRGNKSKLYDPSMGIWEYKYNGFSELVEQTDANLQKTKIEYDLLGRLQKRTDHDGSYTLWSYDTSDNSIGKVNQITSYTANDDVTYNEVFEYDNLGRLWLNVKQIDGQSFATKTEYDTKGRVKYLNYPETSAGSLRVRNDYDNNGFLVGIYNTSTNEQYFKAKAVSIYGQLSESVIGNAGIKVNRYYDDRTGFLTGIKADYSTAENGGLQNIDYEYTLRGNTYLRKESVGFDERKEVFSYDSRNRLTGSVLTNSIDDLPSSTQSYTYDDVGNILTRSDYQNGATYQYNKHRITKIGTGPSFQYDDNGNVLFDGERTYTYSSFNKPTRVTTANADLTFTYDVNRSRITKLTGTNKTTYVGGLLEMQQSGSSRRYKYIIGTNVAEIVETRYAESGVYSANQSTTSYVLRDKLGSSDYMLEYRSLDANQDAGQLLDTRKASFTAFGERRKGSWEMQDPLAPINYSLFTEITNKGFTGHEMDDEVNLVNMKGRIYSPQLGRFTTPDPHIQDPGNPQNLTRYSYVWNNPLTNVDPSGYYTGKSGPSRSLIKLAYGPLASQSDYKYYATGLQITGVAFGPWGVAVATFVNSYVATDGDFRNSFFYAGKAFATDAFFMFAFGAAGEIYPSVKASSSWTDIGGSMLIHGTLGGYRSTVNGGKFSHGFLYAAVSKGASISGIYGNINDRNIFANLAISATIGGTLAKVTGGKFANGAVTAAFSRLYNDLAHSSGGQSDSRNSKHNAPSHISSYRVSAPKRSISALLVDGLKAIARAAWWVAGKVWALPNTLFGLVVGAVGIPFGASVSFGNNSVQFENYPWGSPGAITFGNVVVYNNIAPSDRVSRYDGSAGVVIGTHEMAHTFQYEVLGPFYAFAYFGAGGAFTENSPFENAADNYAEGSGSWWPW